MSKIMILGGGGAFGIHTAFKFIGAGHSVLGVGRSPLRGRHFSLGIERYAVFNYRQCHVVHELDILLDLIAWYEPDVIINFAAQGEGAASWSHSWRFFQTNCVALSRLVEKLENRQWSGCFIHIGSSEVYGSVTAPVNETALTNPSSPYAASKLAFDHYLLSMFKHTRFNGNIVRPSNCYCEGQLLHRVVPKAIICGLTGTELPLHGGGKAMKSYLHVSDLAKAIYDIWLKGSSGEIYNVGPDNPVTVIELVERCADTLGISPGKLYKVTDGRSGEDSLYWLDSSKVKALGWTQQIDLDAGLRRVEQWGRMWLDDLRREPMTYSMRD